MRTSHFTTLRKFGRDSISGLIVFLIAVPLCLGIALASNAPLLSGVVSGIIGGIVVGTISGSHTSVSGPAAALAAIVAGEIARLGSFSAFQTAVIVAGVFQIVLAAARAGSLAAFLPSSVIKGLLTAIGILLILKQIPHLLGHDADPTGEMAFFQPDKANTFSELVRMFDHIHLGACLISVVALAVLIIWERVQWLKKSPVPAPLVVVLVGIAMGALLQNAEGHWSIESSSFVQVPVTSSFRDLGQFVSLPDFSQLNRLMVYQAGLTVALAASLATLMNLESVDKLDARRRRSPPSRELFAQGIGNITSGLIGGIPMTSEIIRGSVNINAGSRTKLSTIVHGVLLAVSIVAFPIWLNRIPLACLAAILFVTGAKLASPTSIKKIWQEGRYQFIPFALTVVAIVMTDLLIGVLIGLGISLAFILNSNLRRPIQRYVEKHLGGEVLRVTLANQVSFLNRAALIKVLDEVPAKGHLLLDAQDTDYIDPDILGLIRDYSEKTAPARNIRVSLLGFRRKYQLKDQIHYVDYSTREIQQELTPVQVLQILKDGHQRFRSGQRLSRDLNRQVRSTAEKQHPLAVILSCIDSRAPTELLFDLGLGDVLSIRIAGNITSRKILASMEYACAVAGAKLIVVMGHSRCGAITTALELTRPSRKSGPLPCQHLESIIGELRESVYAVADSNSTAVVTEQLVTAVSKKNVERMAERIFAQSETLETLRQAGQVAIVGAFYDVTTGEMEFLPAASSLNEDAREVGSI